MSEKLSIVHRLAATPDIVFRDFVDPEFLKRWFVEQDFWSAEAHTDLRIGGKYDVTMTTTMGNSFTHDGIFEEIIKDSKLRFTWGSGLVEDTNVTITFNLVAEKYTVINIVHENFLNVEVRDQHILLWENCLRHLEEFIANPSPYSIYQDPDYPSVSSF